MLKYKHMETILDDENLFYIGGVVRDEILGRESFDIDITYQGNAIEFCKELQNKGLGEIKQINEAFGTVRMLIDNKEVDFASTRDEIYEKKGHLPIVSNLGCELKKDVLRRDFTVNAIAKSLKTNEIIDYTGGIQDIKSKTLRILYDDSFIDDPTRIVRGLKFSVRFGFHLEGHTKKMQEKYLDNINYDMSYKRLKKELTETFNLNSQEAFREFFRQDIYKLLISGEVTPPDYDIENLINRYPVVHPWLVYLGWMGLDMLPLTSEEQKIVDDYNSIKDIKLEDDKFFIYKTFSDKTRESVLLYVITSPSVYSDLALKYFELENIRIDLDGEDLKKLNIEPSPLYKECFDYILKHKLEVPSLTKSDELELAKEFLKV